MNAKQIGIQELDTLTAAQPTARLVESFLLTESIGFDSLDTADMKAMAETRAAIMREMERRNLDAYNAWLDGDMEFAEAFAA